MLQGYNRTVLALQHAMWLRNVLCHSEFDQTTGPVYSVLNWLTWPSPQFSVVCLLCWDFRQPEHCFQDKEASSAPGLDSSAGVLPQATLSCGLTDEKSPPQEPVKLFHS